MIFRKTPRPKIHHQIHLIAVMAIDFGIFLDTSKVLDARRRGVTIEAYKQYAARRNERPSSVAGYCGGWKGNAADDILMVDQGRHFNLDT